MSDFNPTHLIVQSTPHTPLEILEKIKRIFQAKGITLFALIDHAREAHRVDLDLPYAQLLIFGDPKTGTLLMQENPSIGIELPLKILLWQDSQGMTQIAYKDPIDLADKYGIKKNAAVLQKMKEALSTLIDNAKK